MRLIRQYTICLAGVALSTALAAAPSVIPMPLLQQVQAGHFEPGETVPLRVEADDGFSASAEWLAGRISRDSSFRLELKADGAPETGIRVRRIDRKTLTAFFAESGLNAPLHVEEAYSLDIDDSGVLIRAAGEPGLFYGMVSLWQWLSALPPGADSWPAVRILDAPQFSWRGLMLDSARHMQSVEFIKQYIDWMALHKLNVFHWHLSDDQAWRLEINSYPRLTEVGGFRVPAGDAPAADIDPATGMPRLYGGFYTQEEVREIVTHAASRQITVVPEIDVPGHATAAIAAYPELGVDDHGIDRVPASWGIFHNVFNLEESTFRFLETVLGEVVELFPGPFIHLGGDEVETAQWAHSDRVRQRMSELGIDDLQTVQNYFVERLQTFLDRHGRRLVGWDEILQGDLPPHAVVMSWRGVEGAIEAAAKGHQAVLSPAPTLYLDHIQTAAADAPPGRGGIITTRDIYNFNPLPVELQDKMDRVLGLQGNVWTEHIRTEERVAYMTWPRAAAIAELGWSAPQNRNWESFASRLPAQIERLRLLDISAAADDHALYGQALLPPADAVKREDRELTLCTESIVLALEDDAPLEGERESFLVDIQNPCWIWKQAELSSFNAISASVGQLPFNFEIGKSIEHVVVEPMESRHGELRVRLGSCDGPVIADLPLEPAVNNPAVTELPPARISLPGNALEAADLCFSFTRAGVAPIWVIDWVRLDQVAP